MTRFPSRIVCLTEETTETLYLLGQGDRIVGVSGYTVRPPEARQKPKISAFINAKFDKIVALEPDLVLAFSDLQADLVRGAGSARSAGRHIQPAQRRRDPPDDSDARRPRRLPGGRRTRWPIASRPIWNGSASRRRGCRHAPARVLRGVGRAADLGHPLGGRARRDRRRRSRFFRSSPGAALAKDRIVDPAEVARRDPQVVFASWCGKKMKKATIQNRPGWDRVAAVRDDRIFEIKSTYILQPGPACLTDGVAQLHERLRDAAGIRQR